jgi:MFS family permease
MTAAPALAPPTPARILAARIAVSIAFFLVGAGNGIWAVHIPLVREGLGIDPLTLGFGFFTLAAGAVMGMPITAGLIGRYGSRAPTAAFVVAYTLALPGPMVAGTVPLFFVALFVFGFVMGASDVAANVQASEVEVARGRPTMSSFHGFYSVGALSGGAIGAGIIAWGLGDGRGATIAAAVFLLAATFSAGALLPAVPPAKSGPRFALPSRAMIALGFLAFLAYAAEGAITDWGALFLTGIKQASPESAALGFSAFALAMSVFRLFGDPIVTRLGARTTILGGGVLIALGLAVAIPAPAAWLSAAGFVLVGIGVANVVPVVFSMSARTPGVAPGIGVASVATFGYAGFLLFPPILGFVANHFGLSASLGLVLAMGVVIALVGARR